MSEIISLGEWIKRRRKALDLTQGELAQRVGCSLALIQKIEGDARRPSRELAALLADHLRLADDERGAFIQAARAELGADRLAPPAQSLALGAFVPAQAVSNADIAKPRPSTPPNNLPAPPTALIGREQEIATITSLLRRADVRLVTLTGPGGIGKTRLGLQIAANLVEVFADGVFFVDLAPVRDPDLVIGQIATALGVREAGGQPLIATLKEHLRDKHMLLLLDNFEQVIDAAPIVAELLTNASQLKVLVTSREILRLRGEHEVAVPPLALPPADDRRPTTSNGHDQRSEILNYGAVDLFLQRAGAVQPAFQITIANASAVAAICARLDGLPLAIELAASRVKLFTPEALLTRLDSRLALLTSGARDLPARQQTIRDTIAWSYDLLTESEQTLFRQLGVFVGGCTLEAINTVCAPLNEQHRELFEDVAALLDKSLLRQREDPNGATRFTMLETIREYALEQLDASSEAESVRRQHDHFYIAFSSQQPAENDEAWIRRLDPDYDNLRVALDRSQTAMGNSEAALQLALALALVRFERGVRQEATSTLQHALNHPLGVGRTLLHARVRQELAQMYGLIGDFHAAGFEYEQALELAREIEEVRMTPRVLSQIGWLAREQGDSTTAWLHFSEALAMFREQGDMLGSAWSLQSMAEVAILDEDAPRAEELLAEALLAWPHDESNWCSLWNGWRLNHLGHAAQLRGNFNHAADLHQQALAIFRSLGEQHFGLPWAYHSLGETTLGQNGAAEAVRWFQQGVAMGRQLSDHAAVGWCLAGLGTAAALNKQPERAARLWAAAEKARQAIGCRTAPAARATYERAMAAARAELGEQAFAAAWAAGWVLTLELALAEALEARV